MQTNLNKCYMVFIHVKSMKKHLISPISVNIYVRGMLLSTLESNFLTYGESNYIKFINFRALIVNIFSQNYPKNCV